MMRHYGELTFDIQTNRVKLFYNKQCIVFNEFNAPNRHKFEQFRKQIESSRKYDNINDVYGLARAYEVRGASGQHYIVHKNVAF